MSEEELRQSMKQYGDQLHMIKEALASADEEGKTSLLSLQAELNQLVELTQESLDAIVMGCSQQAPDNSNQKPQDEDELDSEYALFMSEMSKTDAYEKESETQATQSSNNDQKNESDDSDIEEELDSLLGLQCAVLHAPSWGGAPALHSAMVSAVEPRAPQDQFDDLKVRVLFTHPTHAEMLPCPFFLNGECRFSDEQCRYSHGTVVALSELKEVAMPDFESVKVGSRVLVKLKPPDDEDMSQATKGTERYHLWHRAVVRALDAAAARCSAALERGGGAVDVPLAELLPLTGDHSQDSDSDSDSDLSDGGPPAKTPRGASPADPADDPAYSPVYTPAAPTDDPAAPAPGALEALGGWEQHTRGIGSKLMRAMGYVAGAGLGAAGAGRVLPVQARPAPRGVSLDRLMELGERRRGQDPLKLEQRLQRLQKREEERNRRAYEREKEREKRDVFNFLNTTLGAAAPAAPARPDLRRASGKDLNLQQFRTTEDIRKVEKDLVKLGASLQRQAAGAPAHRNINALISEKNKELTALRTKEQDISREQNKRKDKHKMTVF